MSIDIITPKELHNQLRQAIEEDSALDRDSDLDSYAAAQELVQLFIKYVRSNVVNPAANPEMLRPISQLLTTSFWTELEEFAKR